MVYLLTVVYFGVWGENPYIKTSIIYRIMQMWIPLLAAALTIIGALITWFLNERSKRITEEFKRREEKYAELIKNLRGFYSNTSNKENKLEFLNQLNLCWMYCPDNVIEKAYEFLEKVHTDGRYNNLEKESSLGAFILEIRKDLIQKKAIKATTLSPKDFRHLTVN